MPLNAPADYYREGAYHGGTLHTFFDFIYKVFARGRHASDTVAGCSEEELREIVERLTSDPDIAMYAGIYNMAANPERDPLFFDLLANPLDGPFYWERSAYRDYDKIKIPFYTRSGWWAYGHMHLEGRVPELRGDRRAGEALHREPGRGGRADGRGLQRRGRALVRPLAQGDRQRDHGRAADQDLRQGRGLARGDRVAARRGPSGPSCTCGRAASWRRIRHRTEPSPTSSCSRRSSRTSTVATCDYRRAPLDRRSS